MCVFSVFVVFLGRGVFYKADGIYFLMVSYLNRFYRISAKEVSLTRK